MPLITTDVERAVLDLQKGKPVAIPTETVYGLAAMITKAEAIKAIFVMKDRPLNHPLIVHVAHNWDLTEIAEYIPDYAQQLINKFWPGPLTLVLRCKKEKVNALITGGQSTVAVRCPAHTSTQKLLRLLDTPVVAPSANSFGKISPTTALHVKQSFSDKQFTILDGGRCIVGIESTIIDATHPGHYQILRHGLINESEIAGVINTRCTNDENSIRVPGKLESHYQPQKNLYYFEDYESLAKFCTKREGDVYVIASQQPFSVERKHFHLLASIPKDAAFDLYYQLRHADESNAICIAIELPPATSEWQGVRERILKAGFPYSH